MSARRLFTTPLPIGPNRHPGDQVRDAEAFCRRYIDDAFDGWGMYLRNEDYDDSLAILITMLWRLGETFQPERNDCFANYARSIISRRAADAGPRRLLGRTGTKTPNLVYEQLDTSTPERRPHQTLTDEPSHEDPDRGPDQRRLQAERARQRAWAASVLGLGTPRRAA